VIFSFSSSIVRKKLNKLFIDEIGLNPTVLIVDSKKQQFLIESKSYPLKADSVTIKTEKLPEEIKTGPATIIVFFNGLPTARFNVFISKLSLSDLVTLKPLKPIIDSINISQNPFLLTAIIDGKNLYNKRVVVKDAVIATTSEQTVAQIITPGLKFLRSRIIPADKNNLVKFKMFITYEILNDDYKGPAIIVVTTPYGQISKEVTLE